MRATSGLDPVVRDEVLDLFSEFTRVEKPFVLISSHIVSDLEKICDYIAFLHKGKLLLCEEKDRLLEQYGIIHCTAQQLAAMDPFAIKGKKRVCIRCGGSGFTGTYTATIPVSRIDIEQLFIFMTKGVK